MGHPDLAVGGECEIQKAGPLAVRKEDRVGRYSIPFFTVRLGRMGYGTVATMEYRA
jgi:hypothetical protein